MTTATTWNETTTPARADNVELAPHVSEDWLSLIIGLSIFVLALAGIANVDLLGWVVTTSVWNDIGKALGTVSKSYASLGGIGALFATYVALLVVLSGAAVALKSNIKKFALAFTAVFWIAYASWVVGNFANFAAVTPAELQKFGIGWSLRLTNEGAYIFALISGLVIANVFPRFAEAIKDAVRPELYIKIAIVILGGFFAVTADRRHVALDADVALQRRVGLLAAELRLDGGDREAVARRAGDRHHAAGAVDRHAQVVVVRRDAAVELAEVHDGEPVRAGHGRLCVEAVEVGGVEPERGAVGAHEVERDVAARAAARGAERTVGAQELARRAGQRVDVDDALSAEPAAQRGAGAGGRSARPRGRDGAAGARRLTAGLRPRVEERLARRLRPLHGERRSRARQDGKRKQRENDTTPHVHDPPI